jgi:hypothetical protein
VKRTRTRKAAAVEAGDTEAAEAPAEKPVKRTRARKTVAAKAETPAAADDKPAAEKPVKRTRARKTAEPRTAPTTPIFSAPE